jgi:hypothetical protein
MSDSKKPLPRSERAALEREALQQLEHEYKLEAARRADRTQLWGDQGNRVAMERLCALFPTLRGVPGTSPWDAMHLLTWLVTSEAPTSGSRHAAKFVLQVWNSGDDWQEWARLPKDQDGLGIEDAVLQPFNAVAALAVWDEAHAKAFRTWVHTPFFP